MSEKLKKATVVESESTAHAVYREIFTRLSGVVSRIALGLKVGTVAYGDMKYRTVIFSNCLLPYFRG